MHSNNGEENNGISRIFRLWYFLRIMYTSGTVLCHVVVWCRFYPCIWGLLRWQWRNRTASQVYSATAKYSERSSVNSLWRTVDIWCLISWSSLVQEIACHLFGFLPIGPSRMHFNKISFESQLFSFKKMRFKLSSGKYRPFRSGHNVLNLKADMTAWTICYQRHHTLLTVVMKSNHVKVFRVTGL